MSDRIWFVHYEVRGIVCIPLLHYILHLNDWPQYFQWRIRNFQSKYRPLNEDFIPIHIIPRKSLDYKKYKVSITLINPPAYLAVESKAIKWAQELIRSPNFKPINTFRPNSELSYFPMLRRFPIRACALKWHKHSHTYTLSITKRGTLILPFQFIAICARPGCDGRAAEDIEKMNQMK